MKVPNVFMAGKAAATAAKDAAMAFSRAAFLAASFNSVSLSKPYGKFTLAESTQK